MLYLYIEMNYQQRLLDIHGFLLPYQRIWQNEIMLLYPQPLADYPTDWIKDLAQFRRPEDVIRLEKKEVFDFIKTPSLIDYYRRIEELSIVSPIPNRPPMPETPFTFLYMIPKKQHEIRRLAPFINAFSNEHQIDRIIDIGGGIGLLAQTLCNEYDLKVTSLDMDQALQETGIGRHKKNARHPNNKVEYLNIKVTEDNPHLKEILLPNRMTLGLHTCGPLANSQLKTASRQKISGIVNFGCCYQKLDGDDAHQNISQFANMLPNKLVMNSFALTLSTRAHRKMNHKDYELKLKVKFYRYAIHMLLHDYYEQPKLLTLGNSHPKLYDESFATYALEQLGRIGMRPHHTSEELNKYFEDSQRQNLIWEMLTAGLLRDALGRLLELYILLDRVIYLEEQGYKVQLYEFFDEEISPRNLGIVAHR